MQFKENEDDLHKKNNSNKENEKKNEYFIFPSSNGIFTINDLNKNTLINKIKKIMKNFLKAYLFVSIFKICKSLDRSWNKNLSYDQVVEAFVNFSNIEYSVFVTGIKLLLKFFRICLKLINLENYIDHKRVNFLLGLLANLILSYFSRKEIDAIFVTCIYYLIRNLFSFFNSRVSDGRIYKESKNLYFIGFTLGFITTSFTLKKFIENIKFIRDFL